MRSSWSVLHAKVQVEPVGKLDLEAHPDSIVPLLTWDVQDEPAGEAQEKRKSGSHLCSHVRTQTLDMEQYNIYCEPLPTITERLKGLPAT